MVGFSLLMTSYDKSPHHMLLPLFLLSAMLLSRASADGMTEMKSRDEVELKSHASRGGLHWSNIGVSFEECDGSSNIDCSDDSIWLLHPSSGFVENGSLCGILGPSGKFNLHMCSLYSCFKVS